MSQEIERKYLHADFKILRQSLIEHDAQCVGTHFESNFLFDNEDTLYNKNAILRLRSQEWEHKSLHWLTLKISKEESSLFKKREEYETLITDVNVMYSILLGLGYTVKARYEKVREPWRMGSVEIDLDVLPFENIVEIEGTEESILSTEKILKLDDVESSIKSYHDLHQEWLRQHNKPLTLSFVFDEDERKKWRHIIGLN